MAFCINRLFVLFSILLMHAGCISSQYHIAPQEAIGEVARLASHSSS